VRMCGQSAARRAGLKMMDCRSGNILEIVNGHAANRWLRCDSCFPGLFAGICCFRAEKVSERIEHCALDNDRAELSPWVGTQPQSNQGHIEDFLLRGFFVFTLMKTSKYLKLPVADKASFSKASFQSRNPNLTEKLINGNPHNIVILELHNGTIQHT